MASFASGANVFLSSDRKIVSICPNISTERGAASVVNVHPKEPKIIYCSGKFIVIRSIDNPDDCFVYRGHTFQTTVAKFSPNGFWVCSADVSGKAKIWSYDHPEHLCKLETMVFNGPVLDVDWDFESKKIVAVGEGAGMMAKCFMWDTGNSVGEMVGHNKKIRSVAYKPTRPFRIMTGSEDMRTIFYAGPPFKLDHSNDTHANFVNCVRYSPNGAHCISVSADKKIQFYDGATGLPAGEIPNAHAGTIYSIAFSPDSKKFLTASADKSVKLWDIAAMTCEQTFTFSTDPQIGDMQVAVAWSSTFMLSVSLNGDINILNMAEPVAPARIIQGHQVSITSMYLDRTTSTLFTGSFDGVIMSRNLSTGSATKIKGSDKRNICGGAHSGKVIGLGMIEGGELVSAGWDDCLRYTNCATLLSSGDQALIGQPCGMANGTMIGVATNKGLYIYAGRVQIAALNCLDYEPTCISILDAGQELAVGGNDSKVHVYSIVGNVISTKFVINGRNIISSLSYSPDGLHLAVGDSGRLIEVYERATWAPKINGKWVFHTSRITSLAWSPSGRFVASGSSDENIFIWDFENPNEKIQIPFAHMGGVTGLDWLDNKVLVSIGNDNSIVTWNTSV